MYIRQNGFTLVELAIALMVIGLLIGGVLKGQELIENARVTRFVKDLKDYESAVMVFRSTYNAFPGDIRNPADRIPNCTSGLCIVSGNKNGIVESRFGTMFTHEHMNFFPHMTKAGLLTNGPVGAVDASGDDKAYFPVTPFGQYVKFLGTAPYPTSGLHVGYFEPMRAMQIDTKLDDGKPGSGIMVHYIMGFPAGGPICQDEGEYCQDCGMCTMRLQDGFIIPPNPGPL